jgi:uncharacterized membrane protein YfcA
MNWMMNFLSNWPLPDNANAMSLLLSSLVVLFAGFVRGLTGFGFSALCVSCLSVFLPPAQVVPALFVLEILASISLLKTCWPDVHWSWLRVLLLGNLVFIPLGVLTQQSLPADTLRLLIAGVIGVIALAQLQGLRPQGPPGKALQWGTGMVSGWLNGLAAIGGIAVAMVFNQTRLAPAVMRASLVVFFLFTDLFALLSLALMAHLAIVPTSLHDISGPTAFWSIAWLPAMLLGIWLGHRQSAHISTDHFRRLVQVLLLVIAALMALRVISTS